MPDEYVVVAKDTLAFTKYPRIPKLVQSTFQTLNNSGDKIILLDSLNRAIDSVAYKSTWGGSSGKSLERINSFSSSVDSTNWKTSLNQKGATPGIVNSVSKKNYDVALPSTKITPAKPVAGETVRINAALRNPGKRQASFIVKLFEILKNGQKQLLKEANINLTPTDDVLQYSPSLEYVIENLSSRRTFEYYADYPLDQDTTNNRIQIKILPGYPAGSIVLNEVMYNPLNGEPEWIELYNNSQNDVDLGEWSITDILTTPLKTKLPSDEYIFPAKSLLVIAKDTTIKNFHSIIPSKLFINSFANLNNDADGVVMKDSRDVTIDSLRYDANWGGSSGKSLERKFYSSSTNDKNNWGSSKDIELSTPGRKNSISLRDYDLSIIFQKYTPSVPIIGDSVKITVVVKNIGLNSASAYSLGIFNDVNKDSVAQAGESIYSKSFVNLAKDDSLLIVKSVYASTVGDLFFIASITFTQDENISNNKVYLKIPIIEKPAGFNDIVINEIMYAPSNDEPEWIEIYNKSDRQLNLKNWKLGDNSSFVNISASDYFLNPSEYLIISSDSTLQNFYSINSKFIVRQIPSLNNSGDDVRIKNNLNATIDSLSYFPTWGGLGNKSIERINSNASSNNSTNWKTSLSRFRATPGKINSVTPKLIDLSIKNLTAGVNYVEVGGSFKLNIILENLGSSNVQSFSIKVYRDKNLNGIEEIDEQIGVVTGTAISSLASKRFEYTVTNSLAGINQIIVKVELITDEFLDNNISIFKMNGVVINERKGDLFVNEIMYAPISPEQEWIEIYNTSTKQIDLKGYKIANHSDTAKVISASTILLPENYFVIAKDTAGLSKY